MDNQTADRLIERTANGDNAAFEELYNSLSKSVYAFALSIVRNDALAQDIMQDTFIRVFRSAKNFKAGGSGIAWIMKITRNLSITAVSKPTTESEELIDSSGKAVPSAEDSAVIGSAIKQALSELSERERQLVTLHAVSGLTLGEIAKITDEPLGTVKWRHAQAIKKLKLSLGEEG